jgi:tetratricopeptide (TPR) repeat protein
MRNLILILLLNFSNLCWAQTNIDSIDMRINLLVEKSNNKTINKGESKELRNHVFDIQNKGFMLEEERQDYQNALMQIDKALYIWVSLKDTLSEANLRKFRGLLLGHLKRYKEAESEAKKAISLYDLKNFKQGVAVSQHDLSLIFDLEGKIDSALHYENKSNFFWNNKGDTSRIIVSNNQLIHLFCQSKDFSKAEKIQNQSENLIKNSKTHWHHLINFYYVSFQLYDELKSNETASIYKKLYNDKIDLLKKEGIMTKSVYEKD